MDVLSVLMFSFFAGISMMFGPSIPIDSFEPVTKTAYSVDAVNSFIMKTMTDQGEWQDTQLTAEFLVDAKISNEQGNDVIKVILSNDGASIFEQITRENINKPVGIFVNGELISSPRIGGVIIGKEVLIVGDFTQQEMRDLVLTLKKAAGK